MLWRKVVTVRVEISAFRVAVYTVRIISPQILTPLANPLANPPVKLPLFMRTIPENAYRNNTLERVRCRGSVAVSNCL